MKSVCATNEYYPDVSAQRLCQKQLLSVVRLSYPTSALPSHTVIARVGLCIPLTLFARQWGLKSCTWTHSGGYFKARGGALMPDYYVYSVTTPPPFPTPRFCPVGGNIHVSQEAIFTPNMVARKSHWSSFMSMVTLCRVSHAVEHFSGCD